MIELNEVIEWLKRYSGSFINARKLARKLNVSSKVAGHVLKQLRREGYVELYNKRRGRFTIYKVNKKKLSEVQSKAVNREVLM
ncbi:MAG: hypothetical protein B7O98_04060 [Zestosphaera tikiterensis]|uniref:Helix-turn-helix type 11 domain-containing protein n=1 Tax=Zestosphaera tikiterensis TaxID=1973259 RepID=A0A2R7Y8G0_9CREN|nr:MAG: hypothetical protein B7O98_04060 [Zestosphaera tikiterensis]